MTDTLYQYRGELVRAVDGDTVILRVEKEVDFGFRRQTRFSSVEEFRIQGIDTPEKEKPTKAMGDMATEALHSLLWGRDDLEVLSLAKDDKYGRWIAKILVPMWLTRGDTVPGPIDVTKWMIDQGYARPYDGKGPRLPWDPNGRYPL